MNPERLQLKGLLAENKKKFRTLDTESSGLILIIRSLLNPYEDVLKLDMEKISVSVNRLYEVQNEMKETAEKIKKLEAEFD
ncbi:hypothetical protein J6I39_06790 [bacterium]|nr:hypothetical protein [bacterium]